MTIPRETRTPAALALASIPPAVINLVGDARVSSFSVSRGGAWLGSHEERLPAPLRVEEALVRLAPLAPGLRALVLELESGACLWLGASFRFAFLESAEDAAARKAALAREGATAPAPFVRAWR